MRGFVRAFLVVAAVAATTTLWGQEVDLLPGYVVTSGGDTIRGVLNPGKDAWNASEIVLWPKWNSAEPRRFQSGDFSAFGIVPTDEHYVRRTVQVEQTPENLPPQQRLPKINWVEKTVFLRRLVSGELDLYAYYDSKWHYFTGANGKLDELINITYRPYGYPKSQVYKLFNGQLDSLTASCQKGKTNEILFREGSITRRVSTYNQCKSSLQYVRTKGKPYFNATLFAGQSFNSIGYTGKSNTQPQTAVFYAADETYSTPTSVPVGVSLDFSRKQLAKFKLNLEVVHRPTAQFTASNDETDPNKLRRDYFIEIGYTGLNVGFKTRLVRGRNVQVFIQGDYSMTLSTQLRTYEVFNIQSPNSLTLEPMSNFSNSGSGFLGGIQLTYRRFNFLARWETISFTAGSSSIQQDSFSFLAGISLFRH